MESNNNSNNGSSGGSNGISIDNKDERSSVNNIIDVTNIILSNNIEESLSRYRKSRDTILIQPEKDDDAEKILINEINNCTTKDRNEIQEEIHGVHCMAADETPELLTGSLKQLSIELDNDDHIPLH
jgi:hypothetical protein